MGKSYYMECGKEDGECVHLRTRVAELEEALTPPGLWSEAERDGMAQAYSKASERHGHLESLFAVAAWLLKHRATISSSLPTVMEPSTGQLQEFACKVSDRIWGGELGWAKSQNGLGQLWGALKKRLASAEQAEKENEGLHKLVDHYRAIAEAAVEETAAEDNLKDGTDKTVQIARANRRAAVQAHTQNGTSPEGDSEAG